ncbi:MAG: ABC transporter substrate-binding protein [Burkholderiaceae bacterium]|nr:ABC transporter substrate-binding protein [Burkholderiaceae bacterium]
MGAAASAATVLGSFPGLARATQGVSKGEIAIGSLQDLSGPIAVLGKPVQNGMILRVEQVNAAGGIHGRMLKLYVEDSGYDPKKGVLGAQKLVSSNKVFAMLGTLGSVVSLSTIPLLLSKGVVSFMPITAHHGNVEPFHKLKFGMATPYQRSTELGIQEMLRRKAYKRVGIMYQDDEYGLEVYRGAQTALKAAGLSLVEKTSYKRGATEFSSQMQKLKAANCDLIVLGTIVRETIGGMATARKLGYTGDFFGSQAAYMPLVPLLGKGAVEGLYSVHETPTPYRDDPNNSKLLNEWMDAYKARFGAVPDLWSATGYLIADMFVKAATAAGPKLTTDGFVKAMESMTYPRGPFGNPEYTFGPKKHLGNSQVKLAVIRNGRWASESTFLK